MQKSKKDKTSNKKREDFRKAMLASVPDDIKIIYGRFVLFSIIYLVFFFIVYPFYLMYRINKVCSILIFIILIIFYVYMIVDVWKKRKTYMADGYVFFIPLVFVGISFSIIKFLF